MLKGLSFDYQGAKVLVTGGSNGIGLGAARAYLDAGADVIVTGRKSAAADYADNDLSGLDYRQLEVSSREQINALAQSLSSLDILVNAAGGAQADEWQGDDFDRSVDVNLNSVFHMSCACKELLTQSQWPGGASVAAIASMTTYFGFPMIPGYGAGKGGLAQLVKTLGAAWAKQGIRANAVAAGFTRSNMTQIVIDSMPEYVEQTMVRQAIKRVGEPEDIAAALLFLTSASASWITGQTLPVDGGYTITLT